MKRGDEKNGNGTDYLVRWRLPSLPLNCVNGKLQWLIKLKWVCFLPSKRMPRAQWRVRERPVPHDSHQSWTRPIWRHSNLIVRNYLLGAHEFEKKIKMILTTIDDELYIFALAPKETCRIPGFAMTRWQNKKTKSINQSMVVDNLNNSVIDIKTVYFRSVYFSSGLILWASSHECMSTHRIQLIIPNSPSAKQET